MVWSRRQFRMKYKNSLSRSFRQSQGVPQGSVLIPVPFALFIAGIEKKDSQGCEIGIFADDIIWRFDRNIEMIETELINSLESIQKFAKIHELNFNPKKSVASFFTTNKRLNNYQPKIFLDGHLLVYEQLPEV
ncbi:hypothetical protein AVEN_149633-1 [Araneus ventricosus]|uniref:Reverse transcriptase domain-containing protein n=1 Tax=Araneus ventricosus TaxID=182803 RepID=A0A4Y2QW81_ARAVE|nr:hypothetical protein AVEN_28503-1 [Araneus ventricosus]GBN67578.1 hypothetical protein AVEN_49599-1 [Araneus ventricosus]GBN67590.1 hypothetical protein AVEN_66374-1 [Araneus ventricosus]GBN67609.1 hypothetical protein AVEN_149633-1 [Araneus ventricosus]